MRSYRTFPPLPKELALFGGLNLYSTFPKVSLAGRYPARCPLKPGLSSDKMSAIAQMLNKFTTRSLYRFLNKLSSHFSHTQTIFDVKIAYIVNRLEKNH